MVASFTDAWIETLLLLMMMNIYQSHLLQMRGLKHVFNRSRSDTYLRRIFYRCVD